MTYEQLIVKIEKLSVPEPNTGCWLWTGSMPASKHKRSPTVRIDGRQTAVRSAIALMKFGRTAQDVRPRVLSICGLLCNACNIGLGAFADEVRRLRSAILYLSGANAEAAP